MRETEILVEQQPLQGVFICDHAGRVINKFSKNPQQGRPHHVSGVREDRRFLRAALLLPTSAGTGPPGWRPPARLPPR